MSLKGKVALVTGASRGIGLVIARNLALNGMTVAMNARSDRVTPSSSAVFGTPDYAATIAELRRRAGCAHS